MIVDLEKGTIDEVYKDFTELVAHTNCLESWEEIDLVNINPNDDMVLIDDLVKVAMFGALETIGKGIGAGDLFSKNDVLLRNLINAFFKEFNKIPKSESGKK